MKINYKIMVLILVGFQGCYMHASTGRVIAGELNEEQRQQRYQRRKQEILSDFDMSSSAYDTIREKLVARKVSESDIEKIIEGYRRAFMVEIDLEARNSCIKRGFFLITPGFFGDFFKDLQIIISASFVQFIAVPEVNNVLQQTYIKKFLDDEEYLLPQHFFDRIGNRSDREIEQVYESLRKAYDLQGELLKDVVIKGIKYEGLEKVHDIIFDNYEKLQEMYYFLEAKLEAKKLEAKLEDDYEELITFKQRSKAKLGSKGRKNNENKL